MTTNNYWNKIISAVINLIVPAVSIIIGHLLTLFISKTSKTVENVSQHFAGGIVCAVAALELMPILKAETAQTLWVLVGAIIGLLTMFLLST